MMAYKPCMSYCKHGGVCNGREGHKGKHDSSYCTWDDEEGLNKREADKILIEKEPVLGVVIAETEKILLDKMGIKY